MSVCSSVKIIYLCGAECILHKANILKVFSHCPNLKMWQFSTNQGQRTALISCLDYGRDAFCVLVPHIYSSVGYCVVYLIRVCHNLQIDKRNQLHTFFAVISNTI